MSSAWRSITCVNRSQRCCLFLQKRHRYKKKWAVNLPSKTGSELALEHFDAFYKPYFGSQWPSVRVSLLSLPKYAAVINNATDSVMASQHLTELGAVDLIEEAANLAQTLRWTRKPQTASSADQLASTDSTDNENIVIRDHDTLETVAEEDDRLTINRLQDNSLQESRSEADPPAGQLASDSETELYGGGLGEDHPRSGQSGHGDTGLDLENVLTPDALQRNTDLQYFMPTQQVFSEKEQLRREEFSQSTFQDRPISVATLPGQVPVLPKSLRVMVFPRGQVADFPPPKAEKSHLLNYYLLDAASILPVLALDIRPNDYVLDLCAAPGGKTLAMLQMIVAQGGHVSSNDVSQSRVRRLRTVLRSYLPEAMISESVTVSEANGSTFRNPVYSKVLVDVPCNSDRHVLFEEENNLFKPGRIKDRLKMTTVQKNLLLAGIRSCKPGGSVVYSTCTLGAVQNDGVVQAALEEVWETSHMDVMVEDLTPFKDVFAPFFKFHSACRLGQLVLPSLLNNYGPTYFCKLRRLH